MSVVWGLDWLLGERPLGACGSGADCSRMATDPLANGLLYGGSAPMTVQTATIPTAEQLARFDAVYREAAEASDPTRIPWDDDAPNPHLVQWLDREAPAVLRCGSRVAVIGCGRGHDARELMRRGYEVTAFDISPTAVAWAKRLDPENGANYIEANVLEPPARWIHRFDLVVEINTVQSLPPECRPAMVDAIAKLVGMRGHLMVICRATDTPVTVDDGPPWALTESELTALAAAADLHADRIDRIVDGESPPKARLRALFSRQ